MKFPTEHSRAEVHGFDVQASTHTDPRYWQGSLIGVGLGGESRWLTPLQALELATALIAAVNTLPVPAKVAA